MQKDMHQFFVASTDPIERRQAPALQMILIAISSAALVALIVFLVVLGVNPTGGVPAGGAVLVMLTSLAGLAALRRGNFRLAVLSSSVGLIVAVFFVTVIYGYPAATPFLPVVLVPIILTGLLIETRPLLLIAAASALISAAIFLVNPMIAPFTTVVQPQGELTIVAVALFLLVLFVVTTIIALFSPILRLALTAALARERELEQLRDSLEATVNERTAGLREALRTVEQREAQLQQALVDLQASQATIRELSAPVLPVLPGVLIAPLVGAINESRATVFVANVLHAVERERAQHVIFDVTGVPLIDTQVACMILQAAEAVRLLGAQVILCGIRPEVAQTVVGLGVVLKVKTYADLQQAISVLSTTISSDTNRPSRPLSI